MARIRRTLQTLSDQQLYELLLSGSESERNNAFEEIYHRYSTRLYMYCLKILGNTAAAQDACQEAFILFWRSIEPTRTMTNLPAFLLRIARNVALRSKSESERNYIVEFDEAHLPYRIHQPVLPTDNEQAELAYLISMALELLPPHYREAIILQCYDGLSYREVADILNVPLSTVRNWIVRAKMQLRTILEPYWNDDPEQSRTVGINYLRHHE